MDLDLSSLGPILGGGVGVAAIAGAVGKWLGGRSTERRDALQQALVRCEQLDGQVQAYSTQLVEIARAHTAERVTCAEKIAVLEVGARQCAEQSQHQSDELRIMRARAADLEAKHIASEQRVFDTLAEMARMMEASSTSGMEIERFIRAQRRSITPRPFPAVRESAPADERSEQPPPLVSSSADSGPQKE